MHTKRKGISKQREEKAFKIYITEAVKNINKILAENFTGSYMAVSYEEMLNPKPVDERTGEEIVEDIRNGLKRLTDGRISTTRAIDP